MTLSKSIGGGLPMAVLLMRPELDQWQPGEHTGTFRGNNLAFIAATELLSYWDNDELSKSVAYKGEIIKETLSGIAEAHPEWNIEVRGRGMIWGMEFPQQNMASEVAAKAFENGVVIETSGAESQVVKFLPPLTIEEETLREGLKIIEQSVAELISDKDKARSGDPL